MAAEEATSLAGVFSNKSFLDFVGIAIVAPIIASIIAIITARMGITGRIRRLELAEKRIEVITALLSKSDLDDELRDQLRSQMHDITAELISDYGGHAGPGYSPAPSPCAPFPAPGTAPPRAMPTAWAELSRWRRWLFPPFTRSILSWICGIFYYYLLFTFVLMLFGFIVVMTDGSGDSSDIGFAAGLFPALAAILYLLRLGMRRAFNEHYAGQVERRRVSEHTRSGPRVAV